MQLRIRTLSGPLAAVSLLAACGGGATITGQLARRDGSPLDQHTVRFLPLEEVSPGRLGYALGSPMQETVTDAEGRFTIGLNRGKFKRLDDICPPVRDVDNPLRQCRFTLGLCNEGTCQFLFVLQGVPPQFDSIPQAGQTLDLGSIQVRWSRLLTEHDIPEEMNDRDLIFGRNLYTGALDDYQGDCLTCHGANGEGVPGEGPSLSDAEWIHSDGSFAGILQTVRDGVPASESSSGSPMPPLGGIGSRIFDREVSGYSYARSARSLAAYTYLLGS